MTASPDNRRAGEASPSSARRRWWGRPVGESLWPLELARLLTDPVWRGVGVPTGVGRPVLLVPGFMASDASLDLMGRWLTRNGHRVAVSGIRWNVGCADRYLASLRVRLRELHEETGQKVSIVGHSRGGLLGNALAGLEPDRVAQVITLGSPLADNFDISVLTGFALAGARRLEHVRYPESRSRGCLTESCLCSYAEGTAAQQTRRVPLTCVITPDDGIVRPASCEVPGAHIVRVRGSHIGLAWNPQVYRAVATALSSAITD